MRRGQAYRLLALKSVWLLRDVACCLLVGAGHAYGVVRARPWGRVRGNFDGETQRRLESLSTTLTGNSLDTKRLLIATGTPVRRTLRRGERQECDEEGPRVCRGGPDVPSATAGGGRRGKGAVKMQKTETTGLVKPSVSVAADAGDALERAGGRTLTERAGVDDGVAGDEQLEHGVCRPRAGREVAQQRRDGQHTLSAGRRCSAWTVRRCASRRPRSGR